MWYTHTMEYYSVILKKWNSAICSNVDGQWRHYTKWNVRQRKTNIIWYHLDVESKKYKKLLNIKNADSDIENNLVVFSGRRKGESRGTHC